MAQVNLDDIDLKQVAADVRLLLDGESVEDVNYDAALDGTDRVVLTVAVEGEDGTRRYELTVRELTD